MPRLRFVTWNWNVFNPGRTADKLELLERLQPDVAALQEVSRPTAAALRAHFPGSTVLEGLSLSQWDGDRANGAVLLIRAGLDVIDVAQPQLDGWEQIDGPADAVPPVESLVMATITIDGRAVTVAAAHPPNASGRGPEREWRVVRKLRTYAALEHRVTGKDPLILGMDSNAWVDSVGSPFEPLADSADPQQPIMDFLRAEPSRHGLRDAFRSWLEDHPGELEEIRRRRPHGPLATTYVRGGNYPVPDRFDVVMVSPSVRVGSVAHGYEDSLAAGSDHAYVMAELVVGGPSDART